MGARSRVLWFSVGCTAVLATVLMLLVFGVFSVGTTEAGAGQTQPAVATQGTTTKVSATGSSSLTPSQIYKSCAGGVVEVLATFGADGASASPLGGSRQTQSLGSGFVVDGEGFLLTNAHVVVNGAKAESITVVFKDEESGETTRVAASLVGADESSDVALLKIDPKKAPKLTPLPLGDSSKVAVGESVVAIGNPLGYDFSLTEGIVSALHRTLESPNGSVIADGIQTDAAINEGNSGGPLINSSGEVIGINEQVARSSQVGSSNGLGFAVPINTAVDVMNQLKKSGKVTYAYLGVRGQSLSADVAHVLGIEETQGVLIATVAEEAPPRRPDCGAAQSSTRCRGSSTSPAAM